MATIKISGMKCAHCVSAVTKALTEIEGISEVTVDLQQNEATYTETTPVSKELIKQTISGIGFEVV